MSNLIKRIKAKTPYKDKVIGKVSTVISMLCTMALMLDLGTDSEAIQWVLVTLATATGGKALFHAQKKLK